MSKFAGQQKQKRGRWLTCFVPHELEMLVSPAWQCRPVPLMRIIERIEIEHLKQGTLENGNLFVSYRQFEPAGVSRRSIKPALMLGEQLGLIQAMPVADSLGDLRPPVPYRLTYVPAKNAKAPTHEWKRVSPERAEALVAAYRAKLKAKAQSDETEAEAAA